MFIEGLPQVDSGLVALGISTIGFIAGYVRLEARTSVNSRDIERNEKARIEMRNQLDSRLELIEKKHYELDNRVMDKLGVVMDKLSDIGKIVANIQGQLNK